jgi:hypothetical protein
MRAWPVESQKPRLPTSTQRAPGAKSRSAEVVLHDLGARQTLRAAHGDEVRSAGAGADEDHCLHVGVLSTSNAPLVRWLAGSTTISAPPTRLSA